MKKAFLLFGLIFLLAFSGCLQQDINPTAKKLPEIAAVFQKYPDAIISSFFMRKDVTNLALADIRADCGTDFVPESYWNVNVASKGKLWEFYVDEGVTKVVCVIAPDLSNMPNLGDECVNAADCNDLDTSTKNECIGNPKKCVNTPITECINDDSYCPWSCGFDNDNDCPEIDRCQSNSDCSDSNSLTTNVCEGTPKRCVSSLKTCEELLGNLCEVFEECLGNMLPTTNQGICCDTTCRKTTSCEGVVCEETEKCVNGNCYEKSCAERELPLCVSKEICTEEVYRDDFGVQCCTGECKIPCTTDANCSDGRVCNLSENYCIAVSCEDLGGKTCDEETERCSGDTERTLDNEECCLECSPKKCEEMGGILCNEEIGEVCLGTTTTSFDGECCLDQCEVVPCFDIACAINKKCDGGECILKTCEEMGGIDWELPENCKGNFYRTEGALDCCIEFTCEEMDGVECTNGTICNEDTRLSTDVEKCCTETCIAE